ncbi:serine/threonine-protein kinase [Anabaena subtropica]|uniref:Protein kinase n=1 Tax=Anabaena subtropica FACHB-260 TaxID=2692884 RepID=A0ABR8CKU7_9NOST|nr:serine/threonine-protein kinase [Anabaena subtropica]MBD2343780.1 protein kinase [Anabaena subtropica FACHB-260]
MSHPPSSNSWIGCFVGDNQRYRLDKRLGGGGMGDVFLATDTRVGQQVALKLLKDKLVASAEMIKRFEREIAISAALQSDHIIKISDCGVTPEGYPFYVMEYLRGQTLRQLIQREKQVSVEETVKIMAQVCKGLQLAHQGVTLQRDGGKNTQHIKVVHRDLKPDNIFLVPTELGDWVKILDFGIAKIRKQSSEMSLITHAFIGTFRYSSPEQIQNDNNIDGRADIYSLGIILYEMLSGADPFSLNIKGKNVSEASWLIAHSYEAPKELRSQPGCEHLSVQLEAVVMKCLHKKASDRFASTEELHQALLAALQPATTPAYRLRQTIISSQQPTSISSDNETVFKTLQPVEEIQPQVSSDDETVFKPLQPVEESQPQVSSDDETVFKPLQPVEESQPQFNGDDKKVFKPLQPVEESQPEIANVQQQNLPNQDLSQNVSITSQSNHFPESRQKIILSPQQPVPQQSGQNNPEGTIMQPRPPVVHPQNNPEGTIMQPRPPVAHPQNNPEGTIMQPRPPVVHPQNNPEGTIMQPRPPVVGASRQQTPPDKTLYQPLPKAISRDKQIPDRTIMQKRQPTTTSSKTPEQSIFQRLTAFNQNRPQIQEDTIYQPKKEDRQSQKSSFKILQILSIVLATGMILGVTYHIWRSQERNSVPAREQGNQKLLPYSHSLITFYFSDNQSQEKSHKHI